MEVSAHETRLRMKAGPVPGGAASKNLRRWIMVTLVSMGFVLSMFYRVSLTVISPNLTTDLGLTSAELGLAAATFFYAFAFSQLPLGFALDRLGARLTMTGLGLLAVVGAVLFATAQGPVQLVLARLILGAGMSCNLMGSLTLFAAWFPANRFASISGLLFSLGVLGALLAATPLAWLAQTVGWRISFWGLGAFNLAQVAALFALVRNFPPGSQPPPATQKQPLRGLWKFYSSYLFWALSLATFVRYGFFVALQALWAGPFLIYGLGLDVITAGNALLCLSLGLLVGQPMAGWFSDRVLRSRKHMVWPSLWACGLLTISLTLWGPDTPTWLVMVVFVVWGVIVSPGNIIYAHIKEIVPPDIQAKAMTSINLFTMLGGAVFTQILGLVVAQDPSQITEPSEFNVVWLLGASTLAVVGVMYLFTPDSRALKKPQA
ncbi:MAG: MFS transporter [Desulfarculaceae bacterium]|jgi:MFS family permease